MYLNILFPNLWTFSKRNMQVQMYLPVSSQGLQCPSYQNAFPTSGID